MRAVVPYSDATGPARPSADWLGLDHELCGPLGVGDGRNGRRDVLPDHLLVGRPDRCHQVTQPIRAGRVLARAPAGEHVDGVQLGPAAARGQAGRPVQQSLALGLTRERHDQPFPVLHVGGLWKRGGIDPLDPGRVLPGHHPGRPDQCQLTQRGQGRGANECASAASTSSGMQPSVREPTTQGLRGDVDQLQLLGLVQQPVGDNLPGTATGDLLDDVRQGGDAADVERGDHIDTRLEQFLGILPAVGMPGPRGIVPGQVVDQDHRGTTASSASTATTSPGPTRSGSTPSAKGLSPGSTVRSPVSDDDIGAAGLAPTGLGQGGHGWSRPRGATPR